MTNLNKHFYQAIVFDLDGTLLDSWPCLLNTVRRVALTGERALHIDALRLKLPTSTPMDSKYKKKFLEVITPLKKVLDSTAAVKFNN